MATHLENLIAGAVASAYSAAFGEDLPASAIEIRPTDRPEFGDYSTNAALVAASNAGTSPRDLAADLAQRIAQADGRSCFREIQVAGPGFVNFFFQPTAIQSSLSHLLGLGDRYGRSDRGEEERIQIEFVSSNPTGPLTVGHGRQAVLGDVLANLYERLGFDVSREYYFNDEGRQIDLLAESLWIRYRELFGEDREIPEDGYRGEYLKDVARTVRDELGDGFLEFDGETSDWFRREAVHRMTDRIKADLGALGVRFDEWFSEATLHGSGEVDRALAALREHDGVYEQDGAVWLKAEDHGGAKDSVLFRSDGRPTYLMVDIAYHLNKHDRGFDRVIDVQGSDHHAEQTCVLAALRILGLPEGWLSYAVHQFVSLKEGGETLKMSTRAGRFVTLGDLIDELGSDIVRHFMISRKPEAHLDFDLDLARSESRDNPATYVQYAHTRITSIFRKAGDETIAEATPDLSPLTETEELDLIKVLDRFPEVTENAALSFAPHLLADYALQLSRAFHGYYDRHRVLSDDAELTAARLALLHGLRIVLRESLEILGMAVPEEM